MALPKLGIPYYTLELISGKTIQYRPFTVREEKALLLANESKDKSGVSNAIRNTLNACIKTEEGEEKVLVENLPMFDVELLFLHIRMASVGEMSEFNYTCSECEGPPSVKNKLELRQIKVENRDVVRDNKIMLNDDVGVELRYPSFKVLTNKNGINPNSAINAIDMIGDCIVSVYDKNQVYTRKDFTELEIKDFVDSLTQEQLKKINGFFETMPKLTYNVRVDCPCGMVSERKLEGIADFFS